MTAVILYLIKLFGNDADSSWECLFRAIKMFLGVYVFFSIIWLIVGSLYVYAFKSPRNYLLCGKTVFWYAYVSITATWVVIIAIVLIVLSLAGFSFD